MPSPPVAPERLIGRRKPPRRLRLVPTLFRGPATRRARKQRPTPPHGTMCRVRPALIAQPARIGMKTQLGKILPRRRSLGLPAARIRRARIGERTTRGPDLPTGLQTCHGHRGPRARNGLLGNRARRTGRPRPRTRARLIRRMSRGTKLRRGRKPSLTETGLPRDQKDKYTEVEKAATRVAAFGFSEACGASVNNYRRLRSGAETTKPTSS